MRVVITGAIHRQVSQSMQVLSAKPTEEMNKLCTQYESTTEYYACNIPNRRALIFHPLTFALIFHPVPPK